MSTRMMSLALAVAIAVLLGAVLSIDEESLPLPPESLRHNFVVGGTTLVGTCGFPRWARSSPGKALKKGERICRIFVIECNSCLHSSRRFRQLEWSLSAGLWRGGSLRPVADVVRKALGNDPYTGVEPSRCQLEVRTDAHLTAEAVCRQLQELMEVQDQAADRLGYTLETYPVRVDVPDDIYPSPRYQAVARMLQERGLLHSALSVTSFQVNLSFPTLDLALTGYNQLAQAWETLLKAANYSNGLRQERYRQAVPNCIPQQFRSFAELAARLDREGITDPAKLHSWVVIKANGIIEVRAFDATENPKEWLRLIRLCQRISGHPG